MTAPTRTPVEPIFSAWPCPDVHPRVLVCGAAAVVAGLRQWVESAEQAPPGVVWTCEPGALPHVVLICGGSSAEGDPLARRIADWRRNGARVVWFAPPQAAERDRGAVAAASATFVSHCPSGVRRSATGDDCRLASAARGLLHPFLSPGAIGVDLIDIFGVLTASPRRIVYHFDAREGAAAVKAANPCAEELIARADCALLATTYSPEADWLDDCCRHMEAWRGVLAADANVVATLNFKRGNSPAEAEIYVPSMVSR